MLKDCITILLAFLLCVSPATHELMGNHLLEVELPATSEIEIKEAVLEASTKVNLSTRKLPPKNRRPFLVDDCPLVKTAQMPICSFRHASKRHLWVMQFLI